ncbi:hypothetical protein [Deinococcus yunweiensis]|uniref:hypothetical protein n=1 Tax=Deinococcus yunweiensis TaxID=367282 RepID=UPI00398EBA11
MAITSLSGVVVEDASTQAGVTTRAWSGGAGTVRGEVAVGSGDTARIERLVSGTLSASGDFTLELPAQVDSAFLHPFTGSSLGMDAPQPTSAASITSCSGAPRLSTDSARGVTLLVNVQAAARGSIQPVVQIPAATVGAPTTFQLGNVVYVDMPLTVQGRVTCATTYSGGTSTNTLTYRLNLAAGWNRLTIAETAGSGSMPGATAQTFVLTSGSFPTDAWLFSPDTAVQPVKPEWLRFQGH